MAVVTTTRTGKKIEETTTSIIDEDVSMGEGCEIGHHVVIERDVTLGEGVRIEDGVFIGEGSRVGDHTRIGRHAVLREHTWVGRNVTVDPGVILGSDGFGFAQRADGTQFKIPQVGIVEIGDGCHIGARSTIDRATLGKTVLGEGVRISPLVMIGHNVTIGPGCELRNQCGVSGSTRIAEQTEIGTHAGLVGHLKVGAHCRIDSGTGVTKTTPDNTHLKGLFPAMEPEKFEEQQRMIHQLSEVEERIQRLSELIVQAV